MDEYRYGDPSDRDRLRRAPVNPTAEPRQGCGAMLRRLSDIGSDMRLRVGQKAAHLGELARLGFMVPDGVVLTADVYDEFLRSNRLKEWLTALVRSINWNDLGELETVAGEVRERFERASLPEGAEDRLREMLEEFDAAAFAVRSSASSEDLPGATSAGQYESYLYIRTDEAGAYVKRCFASLFAARPL